MKSLYVHSLLCALGVIGLAACATAPDPETKPMGGNVLSTSGLRAARSGPVGFVAHVKPVLEAKCVMCHNHQTLKGHMSLESRSEAIRTGALGAFIIPGRPESSLLITNIKSAHQSVSVMPPVGDRLTADETAILTQWVKEGAVWPEGAAGTLRVGL